MSVDMFTPRVLMGVIKNMPVKPQFLKYTIFTGTITHDTEAVDVDIVKGKRRLAPYTSPVRQGVVVARDGFSSRSIKPGYVKLKRVTEAGQLLNRQPGETIYDGLSPADRARQILAQDLTDLTEMIDLAEEVQCAEALTTGAVTMKDEDGNAVASVDFQLADSHKVTLSGADLWSATTAKPIENLAEWVQLIQTDAGATPDMILMAADVKDAFIAHYMAKDDQNRMNALAISRGQIAPGAPALPGGVAYIGTLPEVGAPMYCYPATYTDLDGTVKKFIPDGKVVVLSKSAMQAKKQYGLIKDLKSMVATSRFAKSWEEEDPSVRFLLVQSAPLMNPYNVDAFMFADVL